LDVREGALEGLAVNRRFWHGKKVLITGHTGFKGSWLSLWLQRLDARVVGYALAAPTQPNLFALADVEKGMVSLSGDVRDLGGVTRMLKQYEPEIVIHMAAQSLVRYSYEHPVETFATNTMGTVNMLEAVRQVGSVRVAIMVTSDKCYENKERAQGYQEHEPMGGHDPYSSSKGCAELATAAYHRAFFSGDASTAPAVATTRAGNVIGGGDWAQDRLVPDIIRTFLAEQPVKVRNPNAIRPWQHVLDPLRGYLVLIEHLWEHGCEYAGPWNFGPDERDAKPVSWVVDRLHDLWGKKTAWVQDRGPHPHEAGILKLDSSKARSRLGWVPRLNAETSLQWTVEWYKGYQKKQDVQQLTEQQIESFQNLSS
jgi:CDP-glucose 4,6-dehydratase